MKNTQQMFLLIHFGILRLPYILIFWRKKISVSVQEVSAWFTVKRENITQSVGLMAWAPLSAKICSAPKVSHSYSPFLGNKKSQRSISIITLEVWACVVSAMRCVTHSHRVIQSAIKAEHRSRKSTVPQPTMYRYINLSISLHSIEHLKLVTDV